jgi:hypothetical protein
MPCWHSKHKKTGKRKWAAGQIFLNCCVHVADGVSDKQTRSWTYRLPMAAVGGCVLDRVLALALGVPRHVDDRLSAKHTLVEQVIAPRKDGVP